MTKIICNKCKGVFESKKALKKHIKGYHSKSALRKRLKAAKNRAKTSDKPFWTPIINSGLPESNRRRH